MVTLLLIDSTPMNWLKCVGYPMTRIAARFTYKRSTLSSKKLDSITRFGQQNYINTLKSLTLASSHGPTATDLVRTCIPTHSSGTYSDLVRTPDGMISHGDHIKSQRICLSGLKYTDSHRRHYIEYVDFRKNRAEQSRQSGRP